MSGRKKELGEGLERFPFRSPKSFFFSFSLFFPRISLSKCKEQPFHYLDTLHQPTLNSGNLTEEERQTVIGAQFSVIFIFFNYRFHNTFTVLDKKLQTLRKISLPSPPPPPPRLPFLMLLQPCNFVITSQHFIGKRKVHGCFKDLAGGGGMKYILPAFTRRLKQRRFQSNTKTGVYIMFLAIALRRPRSQNLILISERTS